MTEPRRVAITGIGLITPFGVGWDVFWSGLMERQSAIRPLEGVDLGDMPTQWVGQIPAFEEDDYLDRKAALWSSVSRKTVIAGMLAEHDAGLKPGALAGPRTGVLLGTGYGNMHEFENLYETFFARGWQRLKPVTIPKNMANAAASHLGIHYGARGVNFTVSTACSSGAIAAGLAAERIRSGELDACVTGGVDLIMNASIVGGWNALRVLSRRNDATASRPFSVDRDGLVLAEGCAVFVLEELGQAQARGARVHAELAGAGATNDATNIVGPDETGELEAITLALHRAGIAADAIDYVCAHGTSTKANDANETRVLKKAFGARASEVPVSSIKGNIGHSMGAAGAIELAATALTLEHQRIPPTLHWQAGDEDCDLDYVPDGPRTAEMNYAMTNSFGFGGQNSVLVLKKA